MEKGASETDGLLWWHRVGQKVVCLYDPHPGWLIARPSCRFPRAGEVCAITAVAYKPDCWDYEVGDGNLPVFFRICIEPMFWFGHIHFRPVKETSIDSFRSLLNPTPDQVREMEDANV